jgi:hypothetical protein
MKKFDVTFEERRRRTVTVSAKSPEAARGVRVVRAC